MMKPPSKKRKISDVKAIDTPKGLEGPTDTYENCIIPPCPEHRAYSRYKGPYIPEYIIVELKYFKWKVDKTPLMDKSTFFEKAFEEGKWKEGEESYIKLHDDDPMMMVRCIEFMYDGTYSYNLCDVFAVQKCEGPMRDYCIGNYIYTSEECSDRWYDKWIEKPVGRKSKAAGSQGRKKKMKPEDVDEELRRIAYSHTPKSEKENDLAEDGFLARTTIDIMMDQLGDKYFIPLLQEHAAKKFSINILQSRRNRRVPYTEVYEVVEASGVDIGLMSDGFKRVLARHIANDYKALRLADDDMADAVKEWCVLYPDLTLMILDHATKLKVDGT